MSSLAWGPLSGYKPPSCPPGDGAAEQGERGEASGEGTNGAVGTSRVPSEDLWYLPELAAWLEGRMASAPPRGYDPEEWSAVMEYNLMWQHAARDGGVSPKPELGQVAPSACAAITRAVQLICLSLRSPRDSLQEPGTVLPHPARSPCRLCPDGGAWINYIGDAGYFGRSNQPVFWSHGMKLASCLPNPLHPKHFFPLSLGPGSFAGFKAGDLHAERARKFRHSDEGLPGLG